MSIRKALTLTALTSLSYVLGANFASMPVCPDGYSFYGNYGCYLLETIQLNWTEAYENCKSKGGFLIEIPDERGQGFILEYVKETGLNYWLGLMDTNNEGVYQWVHSNKVAEFLPWGILEPDGGVGENCVATTPEHHYFWSDEDCSQEFQSICQTPALINVCPDPRWTHEPTLNRCYLFEDVNTMTWHEAVDYCHGLGDGIHLAEMNTPDENVAVQQMLLTDPNDSGLLWIGLNDLNETDRYVWNYSGEEATFFDWGTGKPEDGKHCVLMFLGENYKWYDSLCNNHWCPMCEAASLA